MITLRTMMDGLPHPKAQRHVIGHNLGPTFASREWYDEMHISGSRLGVVFRPTDLEDNRFSVVVWDWTTGGIVLVCGSYYNPSAPIDATYSLSFVSVSRTTVANPFNSWTNTESSFGKTMTTSLTSTTLQILLRLDGRWATEHSV